MSIDIGDLELRIANLRKRFEGLQVGLHIEQYVDYSLGVVRAYPEHVATGWVFGDQHHDVAMYCSEIKLLKPSDKDVASASREGIRPMDDLEQQVDDLEKDFAGLTLTLNRWDLMVPYQQPVGNTEHHVPKDGPNILTGISIGKRKGDCAWFYGTLTLIKERNKQHRTLDGDIPTRIASLEMRFEGLLPALGDPEVETPWKWNEIDVIDGDTGFRHPFVTDITGRIPIGHVMTAFSWQQRIYSRELRLRWPN